MEMSTKVSGRILFCGQKKRIYFHILPSLAFSSFGEYSLLVFFFFFVDAGFQKQVDLWIVTMILTVTRHFVAWIQSSFKPTSVNTEGHCVF